MPFDVKETESGDFQVRDRRIFEGSDVVETFETQVEAELDAIKRNKRSDFGANNRSNKSEGIVEYHLRKLTK